MEFVQVIEFVSSQTTKFARVSTKFAETRRSGGGPKPQSVVVLQDRDHANSYRIVARGRVLRRSHGELESG